MKVVLGTKNEHKLTEFLDDLDYYSGRNLDINELQSLKSDVLDDIIDYIKDHSVVTTTDTEIGRR